MKKVLLSIFAVAALASCFQNEELVGVGSDQPIAFDNAYVGNATKAIDNSFNNTNLNLFQVYGTVTANGATANIFNGVEVSKATGVWKYAEEHTQYWMAGNNYSFKAVVAGNEENATEVVLGQYDMPTAIKVLDASQQKDVLYDEVLDVNYHSNLQPVKFTFEHLLAKAKVTVKETAQFENGGYYVVTNVYLKDTHKTATYTIDTGWADYAEAYDLHFGNIVDVNADENTAADALKLPLGTGAKGASHYERLIIPQNNCELTVVVSYQYWNNGIAQKTENNKEIKTKANIEAGKAYNFVLTLAEPGEKIEFDVEDVKDWEIAADVETVKVVESAADLVAAVADPNVGEVILQNDITLGEKLTRNGEAAGLAIAQALVIDGNGHTLTYTGSDRAITVENTSECTKLTVRNLTLVCSASYCQRGINFNTAGYLVLDNVKVSGKNITYAVNLPSSSNNSEVTINNSNVSGNIALNVWGSNMLINVKNSVLTSVDNSAAENYAAIVLNSPAEGTTVNLEGGKVVAYDEKGEKSIAISCATNALVNIDGTELVGEKNVPVAIVYYANTDNFYSCSTLQDAINTAVESNAAGVRVLFDINLDEPVVIAEGKSVVLDLNGKTITAALKSEGRHHYAIDNYGTLVLEGNGAINARGIENFGTMTINGDLTITNVDTNGGSAIWNEGNLVINAGTFTTNAEAGEGSYGGAFNTRPGGKAVINGGTFVAESQLTYAIINAGETVINDATVSAKHGAVAGATGCKTVINGGSFSLLENPAVSDHCAYYVSEIKGGTFTLGNNTDSGAQVFYESTIASGYKAVENNGVWTVVAE